MSSVFYVDPISGSDSNAGTSFVLRCKTLGHLSPSAGDTVRFIESGVPTSLGVTATWTNLSDTVTLSSAVNATVTNCETNWTNNGVDVTCTSNSSTYRQGSKSQSIVIASGFTTGLAAFFAMSSTDFSAYQQLTFWIQTDSIVVANSLRLDLCSDNAGATPVNSFTIPIDTIANVWIPITIDSGGALSSTIQSIALNCLLDPGAVTVLLDDIIVATAPGAADSLTLNSLISKNTGVETWWACRSILGTTIKLEMDPSQSSTTTVTYYGTTETVTTYKRETVQPDITTGNSQVCSSSGSAGSPIIISGGWDSASMSSQTSLTWLDGRTGQGKGWYFTGNYIAIDKLAASRYYDSFNTSGNHLTGTIEGANNNANHGWHIDSGNITDFSDVKGCIASGRGVYVGNNGSVFACNNIYGANSNRGYGLDLTYSSAFNIYGTINACNNNFYGISTSSYGGGRLGTITANNNALYGVDHINNFPITILSLTANSNGSSAIYINSGCPVKVYNYSTTGNTAGSMTVGIPRYVEHFFNNVFISEGTIINGTLSDWNDSRIKFQNIGGTLNNNHIYTDGGSIVVDTTDPHTGGGLDYKISVTSANRSAVYPIKFSLAKVGVNSGTLVTFSAYIKKSHATDISADLICPGGQIAGVASDIITSATSTSYTQYTITFTPSSKGVVEIFVYVYSTTGSTTNTVKIADITCSQA